MKKRVIDGHNLVPKIPGLSLSDPEDESKLIVLLQEYGRLTRTQIELFFDNAPPGKSGNKGSGLVRIHNVKRGISADDAIIAYMQKCEKNTSDLLLVTSDQRIQAEARSMHIGFINSDAFSRDLVKVLSSPLSANLERERFPSPLEIEEWLNLFSGENS